MLGCNRIPTVLLSRLPIIQPSTSLSERCNNRYTCLGSYTNMGQRERRGRREGGREGRGADRREKDITAYSFSLVYHSTAAGQVRDCAKRHSTQLT
ncbi:Hypp1191 [Branchiostoma lanceolatum]|uniref:Hypp1191 protein n=1 Tax=Branchiostoma lanceolatum TaxID=7740 RepID=A0A8J9ZF99_BRALA|nr:Hypp1191 [Branchiostoma lanceolatum]